MQNALAFAEWHNVKINFLDTPGFPMFVHEARAALLPVEAALLVVNAACGVEAMTRRCGSSAKSSTCAAIVVNQMDIPGRPGTHDQCAHRSFWPAGGSGAVADCRSNEQTPLSAEWWTW